MIFELCTPDLIEQAVRQLANTTRNMLCFVNWAFFGAFYSAFFDDESTKKHACFSYFNSGYSLVPPRIRGAAQRVRRNQLGNIARRWWRRFCDVSRVTTHWDDAQPSGKLLNGTPTHFRSSTIPTPSITPDWRPYPLLILRASWPFFCPLYLILEEPSFYSWLPGEKQGAACLPTKILLACVCESDL